MARYGVETIPPNQIRGRELCEWHIVVVECCYCRCARIMQHKRLVDARHRDRLLSELRFWCGFCKRGGAHTVTITRAPKHY